MNQGSSTNIQPQFMPRSQVVTLVLISEIALILLALFLIWISGIELQLNGSLSSAFYGSLSAIILLAVNLPLFEFPASLIDRALRLTEFRNKIIFPLIGNLTRSDAIILGISSGFAEELFFRGFLQTLIAYYLPVQFAVIISALFFSLIHFGSAARDFLGLVFLYFLVGLYLSFVMLYFDSLFAAMFAHGVYNFLSIEFMKKVSIPRSGAITS